MTTQPFLNSLLFTSHTSQHKDETNPHIGLFIYIVFLDS